MLCLARLVLVYYYFQYMAHLWILSMTCVAESVTERGMRGGNNNER